MTEFGSEWRESGNAEIEIRATGTANLGALIKACSAESPTKMALAYKPGDRWFMPEYHFGGVTISRLSSVSYADSATVRSNWSAENCDLVFAHWWHRSFFWVWLTWGQIKRLGVMGLLNSRRRWRYFRREHRERGRHG